MGIISAVLELIVLSAPSGIYLGLQARHARGPKARALLGLRWPAAKGWILAIGVFVITIVLGYAASRGAALLDPAVFDSNEAGTESGAAGLSVSTTAPSGVGFVAIVLTTLAEEMLFRGFLAGLLIRRLGFVCGNAVQAGLFLIPHALLLAVSIGFWPLLPAQLIAGWLLGWLRHFSESIVPGWIAHAAANILAPTLPAL